jgi:outer membrane receptor protein involved in Fe transport
LQATLVWEHFSEDDDRLRSAKALCTRDPGPDSLDGPEGLVTNIDQAGKAIMSQGCMAGSLYSPAAYTAPLGTTLPFIFAPEYVLGIFPFNFDPYGDQPQSQNLREIGSAYKPTYWSKNDTMEFNLTYQVMPSLTLTSQTGYNKDELFSRQDFNRFDTVPGLFIPGGTSLAAKFIGTDGQFCDPQLGCSDKFLAVDQSSERAEQFYQEIRLASDYAGPFNFSLGASYLHYHTLEDYYVFSNAITIYGEVENPDFNRTGETAPHRPFDSAVANKCNPQPANPVGNGGFVGLGCIYIDPHPLDRIDGQGHNYFRSQNPYRLHSWAGFGEVYYQVTPDVKLTGGLRFTDDMKSFTEIPSWTFVIGKGYVVTGILDQQWKAWTGRFNATWTPELDFTDQSLFYGSYSRGYKGGGANPPGVIPIITVFGVKYSSPSNDTHPLAFKPEYVDAFELGTKNTLLDGAMTLNGSVFYYRYQNYQISQIVDRTSVNLNFNATVKGAELEATWEPVPGLRFNFSGGYEDGTLNDGSKAIDLMDRTAGHSDWVVLKPWLTETSNCIIPKSVLNQLISVNRAKYGGNNSTPSTFSYDSGPAVNACLLAYTRGLDPGTGFVPGGTGFDPATAPNAGQGFDKDISGNKLPNTPPFTLSAGAQYSAPVSADWAATLRADGYWQGNSFARVFNDKPYDQIHGYSNLNLSLTLTNQDGWQAMAYVKNVFDTTAITGAFLNSDDTALTTNVFITDPRLFGIRLTKNW